MAQDQQDSTRLDEIIVTGTKRDSTIQDVPFSINAQTQEDIQRSGAVTLEDLSRNVAGLSIQNLGPGQSQVSVRGVSAGQVVRDQLKAIGIDILIDQPQAEDAQLLAAMKAMKTPVWLAYATREDSGAELEQWATLKSAASNAIVAKGGTITHHHAVGNDHAPYMQAEIGELGLESLRAVKSRLDPVGIMNPGKLVG